MPGWAGIGSGAGTGAALGSVVPGVGNAVGALAGGVIGGLKSLFGNKGAKNEAANTRALQQHGIDTRNLSRKRKASMVGSLLRKMTEHPDVYGKFVTRDMFGELPGPLTAADLIDPAAPKLKTQSNLGALAGGLAGGAAQWFMDRDSAQRDAETDILSSGQPTYRR